MDDFAKVETKTVKEEEKRPGFIKRTLTSYRKIPDKKPYIEFFTAILTIPVLLTVILLNLNTLRGNNDNKTTNTPQTVVVTVPGGSQLNKPSNGPCTPGIGSVDIASPGDRETITENPVFVEINYEQGDFCSVVWSYRINGGKWSEYSDNSIALYNPPSGNIKFELRIKSLVNNDSKTLTRNFTYKGTTVVPTSPVSSGSAN